MGGAVLFVSTVLVGFLNDKSQSEADEKASSALASENEAKGTVQQVLSLSVKSNAYLERLIGSPNRKLLSKEEESDLAAAHSLINQAITRAAAASVPEPQPLPAPLTVAVRALPAPAQSVQPQIPQRAAGNAYSETQLTAIKAAIPVARELESLVAKRDQDIDDSLNGAKGYITLWLRDNPSAKDTDPVPYSLETKIESALSQTLVLDPSKVGQVTSAYSSLRSGQSSGMAISKFRL